MSPQRTGSAQRPLAVVANRLPVQRVRGRWRAGTGGLVTALAPVIEARGGAWIGWDGGMENVPRRVPGLDTDLYPVALSRAEIQGYYYGFANRTIWPLFHDLIEEPVIDRRWWEVYRDANRKFAEVAAQLEDEQAPLLWVQDYHLMLLPALLRASHPDSPIGFFLHIPFPPPELVARLPWRDELLRGLLGADVVGFHTERYRSNFVRACRRVVEGTRTHGRWIALGDRRVLTSSRAISIDADAFARAAVEPTAERELAALRQQFEGRQILLGVDRLDYTKGIRHRLQAIELLLERREDLRHKLAFVQVAVPSRDDVKEYRELRSEIEHEVGRINGRFTEPGRDVPVHYLYRGVTKPKLTAYYRLADVMLVTPLKDGMNLVAKEFVVCQAAGGEAGVLVLSEFAGASIELVDAISCNPFDVEGLSYRIEEALEMPHEERGRRIRRMATKIHRRDVYSWVRHQLGELDRATSR